MNPVHVVALQSTWLLFMDLNVVMYFLSCFVCFSGLSLLVWASPQLSKSHCERLRTSSCSWWAGRCYAWFPLPSVYEYVCQWVNVMLMHISLKNHLGLKAFYTTTFESKMCLKSKYKRYLLLKMSKWNIRIFIRGSMCYIKCCLCDVSPPALG